MAGQHRPPCPRDRGTARRDHPAVRKDLAGVLEEHHAVAEQAPALLRMAGDDLRGVAVSRVGGGTFGLVRAHRGFPGLSTVSRRDTNTTVNGPPSPGGASAARDHGALRHSVHDCGTEVRPVDGFFGFRGKNFHYRDAISCRQWRLGDPPDPLTGACDFLREQGFAVDDLSIPGHPDRLAVVLVGAAAAAAALGAPVGARTPVPAVPDVLVAIYPRTPDTSPTHHPRHPGPVRVGQWQQSWTDAEHAAAVTAVRAAISRGDVYQVNVVGHRTADYHGDIGAVLAAVTGLPGARYAGSFRGDGWAVATASPESLLTVHHGVVRTRPIKGTRPATEPGRRELLADPKERAEHVMIVDLVRNDLGRIATPGTVRVETLFVPREWCGLWQAESAVSARLRPDTGLADLFRAVLPAGSVTGAPKTAALTQISALEPVGRGPAMGAFGVMTAGRTDLGLTIRTLAADSDTLHLWTGGGITWGSDPDREVAEAHAKAAPLLSAVNQASTATT